MNGARTWAEIDLRSIRRNAEVLRRGLPARTGCVAVVKADAYGHGAPEVAVALDRTRLRAFAVTSCSEAAELARNGLQTPILVLGPADDEDLDAALRHDWELVLSSVEGVEALFRRLRRSGGRARVHVKIDTGLHRLGLHPRETLPVLESLQADPGVELVGLSTHLAATSGARDPCAWRQNALFTSLAREARSRGLLPPAAELHAASSAAVLSGLAPLHDVVRPGVALFGVSPSPRVPARGLLPALAWRARVAQTRTHPAGTRIGYGGRFRTDRRTVLATVTAGYEDGVDRRASGRARVLVRGKAVPVVGEVSMDYFTADVTDVPGVRAGDVVTLLGRDGEAEIRVEDLARTLDTIPYQVLCSIGPRVRRLHRDAPVFPTRAREPGRTGSAPLTSCASSCSRS